MKPAVAKRLRLLLSAVSVLVLVAVVAAAWFYTRVRASLPQLEGSASLTGLSAPVTIARDANGVPVVRGRTRADVSQALGWLHAQDRFFQMDVLRRTSAGELAELFGERALPLDRAHRLHGFRARAQQALAALPAEDRALLDRYTAGVNTGLAALGARPFEYLILREPPMPWRAEDTFLVAYTMSLDLQGGTARYEQTLMTLRDVLGNEALAFFAPLITPRDHALDGTTAPLPPIPGPGVIDVRTKAAATGALAPPRPAPLPMLESSGDRIPGSNAFALAGMHTASGAGLLGNDMHLDHGVPNIWYRASLEWTTAADAALRVTGVTLPGLPLVVAGSNGKVAWGFTASLADVADLVVVEPAPGLSTWYMTPGGDSAKFETRKETIRVKGRADETVDYTVTQWGPVVGKDGRERPLALRWVAHDPKAVDLGLRAIEETQDVTAAVAAVHRAGMPAQNILIADATGGVAWAIAGRLPKRVGYDGRIPVSWAYGDRRWDGMLPADEMPAIIHRAGATDATGTTAGRLWSANHRHLGGAALAQIGDGGYSRPHRAGQIRDGLTKLVRATPGDLLALQLDDRALFLEPWHRLLMDTLTPAVTGATRARAGLREYAEKWEGRASVEAISYPIVKRFRAEVRTRVFQPIFARCVEIDPGFDWSRLQLEPALWELLRSKPPHLLDARYANWDELLVAAVDDTITFLDQQAITLPQATWGRNNRADIRHVFGFSMPDWLTGWLRMPADPLPGDVDMPRVQSPRHGASERFVVSPGREEEGIFHMPGGQSGHPGSPFFRAGHEAWVRGEPTPFLPGPPAYTLTLTP